MSQRPHVPEFVPWNPPQNVTEPGVSTSQPTSQGDHGQGARKVETSILREPGQPPLAGEESQAPRSGQWPRPPHPDRGVLPALPVPPRSIDMQAILNPSHNPAADAASRQTTREALDSPATASPASSTPLQTPSPVVASTHADRSRYPFDRTLLSPRSHHRRILTPRSPAVRSASLGARHNLVPGTISVTQSPFLQSPQPSDFRAETSANAHVGPSSTSPAPGGTSQPSFPSAPTSGPLDLRPHIGMPRSRSLDTSPSTPRPPYSHFSQTSPAPHSANLLQQPIAAQVQQLGGPVAFDAGRQPIPLGAGPQYPVEGGLPAIPPQERIPYTLDVDSGSSKTAQKRLKNRDASKRHRDRKKLDLSVLEQTNKNQLEQIKALTEERDFYRMERDYFRDLYSRTPGTGPVPTRPLSPGLRRPAPQQSEQERESQWHEPPHSREELGRNVRPRTGSGPASLGHPHLTPLESTNLPPPQSYQSIYPTPWSATPSTGPPPPETRPTSHAPYPPASTAAGTAPPHSAAQPPRDPLDRSWNPGP